VQDYDDSTFPGGPGNMEKQQTEAEPLDAKSEKEAQSLIEFFGDETAWKLFSKNWTNRVSSLEQIEKETLNEIDRNFAEALHAITITLTDKIAAVVTKA